ncbi:MAG: DUF4974 domain-containing protein [Staphylococcus sp.]|nr:DUF4974 domain-containing protein [Staphylococcus sp.]
MDKYDIVLDLIERPEHYSSSQIAKILADPETREIYNLLCKSESTLKSKNISADVDAEWETFNCRNFRKRFRLLHLGGRAASIAVVTLTSIAALAIGTTIALNFSESRRETKTAEKDTALPTTVVCKDSVAVTNDSIPAIVTPVLFEDESLDTILKALARQHGLTLEYRNPEAATLHLYYKYDPTLGIGDIVEQLNSFEQLNIRLDGTTLIID